MVFVPTQISQHDHHHSYQDRAVSQPNLAQWLSIVLPATAATPHYTIAQRRESSLIPSLLPIQKPVPRTKSLTCSYWHEGHCKYTEEQCLYSHRQTRHGGAAVADVFIFKKTVQHAWSQIRAWPRYIKKSLGLVFVERTRLFAPHGRLRLSSFN